MNGVKLDLNAMHMDNATILKKAKEIYTIQDDDDKLFEITQNYLGKPIEECIEFEKQEENIYQMFYKNYKLIFIVKEGINASVIYENPFGMEWITHENYRGQGILSNFLRNKYAKYFKIGAKCQIAVKDNPDDKLLAIREHLVKIAPVTLGPREAKLVSYYKKYKDGNKAEEEVVKQLLKDYNQKGTII